jgi:hypothetical protein
MSLLAFKNQPNNLNLKTKLLNMKNFFTLHLITVVFFAFIIVSCAENAVKEEPKIELSKSEQELLDKTEKSWAAFNGNYESWIIELEELKNRWEKAVHYDSLDIIVNIITKKSPMFSSGTLKISESIKGRLTIFDTSSELLQEDLKTTLEYMELFPYEKKDILAGDIKGEKITSKMNNHLEQISFGENYLSEMRQKYNSIINSDSLAVSSLKDMM